MLKPKRRVTRRRRVLHRKRGAGFMDMLKSAHNWIKSNKVISTVGNALGAVGVPYAGAIGRTASSLGYGRKRRVGRPRVRRAGGSLKSILSNVHKFVKSNQLVSKGLSHFGHKKLGAVAANLGYGKRRPARRAIRHRGGANFFSTEQLAAPRF